MAKTNRKTKFIFELIFVLITVGAIIFSLVLVLQNANEIKVLSNKINELTIQKDELTVEYEESNNVLNEYNKTIAYWTNMVDEEKANKEAYFALALTIENKVYKGEINNRIAYITVDDGPYANTTHRWIETLGKYDILATFFVNKKSGIDYQYEAMINAGHVLGNHSAGHDIFGSNGIYASSDNFMKDMEKNYNFIYEKFGYDMDLLRFPGGSYETTYLGQSQAEYTNKVKAAGYGYINWNVDSGDGRRNQSTETYISNTINQSKTKKFAVILMHDNSVNSINALPTIIEELQASGYIFLPLQRNSLVVYHS